MRSHWSSFGCLKLPWRGALLSSGDCPRWPSGARPDRFAELWHMVFACTVREIDAWWLRSNPFHFPYQIAISPLSLPPGRKLPFRSETISYPFVLVRKSRVPPPTPSVPRFLLLRFWSEKCESGQKTYEWVRKPMGLSENRPMGPYLGQVPGPHSFPSPPWYPLLESRVIGTQIRAQGLRFWPTGQI